MSVTFSGGELTIVGSDVGDAITVSVSEDGSVEVDGDPDGEDGTFDDVESIVIEGGEGTDSVAIIGDNDEADKISIREKDGDTEVKWKNLAKITASLDSVETLVVDTLGGKDRVTASKLGDSDLASSDTLVIDGGDGDDRINARRAGIGRRPVRWGR